MMVTGDNAITAKTGEEHRQQDDEAEDRQDEQDALHSAGTGWAAGWGALTLAPMRRRRSLSETTPPRAMIPGPMKISSAQGFQ